MKLEVGQRVRVAYEARVKQLAGSSGAYWVALDDDRELVVPTLSPHVKVELVEPEYAEGEFYRDANGVGYLYRPARANPLQCAWIRVGSSGYIEFDRPVRPLVRLVPEVQPA